MNSADTMCMTLRRRLKCLRQLLQLNRMFMDGFFLTKKNANGGSTYSLPKSSSLSDQKSDIIELSPAARRKQENEEKARIIKSDSHTETSTNNLKLSQ